MARRPPHLRWIYVKDHPRPFLALLAVTVLGLAAAAFFLSDPARGLSLGAIPVALGVVVWALTNRAGYPDRDPMSLPHERHDPAREDDQPVAEATAEPPEPAWDPFAGQRKAVTAAAAPADPFDQSPDHPPSGDQSTPHDRRPGDDSSPRKTTPAPQEGESEKAESAPPAARERKVRNTRPRPWDDKPAKPRPSPTPAAKDSKKGGSADPKRKAGSGSTTDAGGTARNSKEEARKKKVAATKGQGSKPRQAGKKSPDSSSPVAREQGDGGKSQRSERPDQPQPTEDETAGDVAEYLSPAEAAIQAAAASKAKRHRRTG